MTGIQVTHTFDTADEARAFLEDISSRSAAPATTPPVTPTAPAGTPATSAPADTVERDADGLPWNEEYHASTKKKNGDGLWVARRGKADEANAARAAFKASGGNTAAPAEATGGMPGMPGAGEAERTAEPVTFQEFCAELEDVVARGVVTSTELGDIYEQCGSRNASDFQTNETLRQKVLAKLREIEGE